MSRENALKSIATVNEFMEETSVLWNQYKHQPLPSSQAAKELAKFSRPESIGTAYSQGTVLIEVAADYVFAVTRTLTEPAQTIAPWTCARGVLETSALALWLLDTSISADERVKRSLAFRYEGFEQQRKLAQSTNGKIDPQLIISRIDEVEQVALKLGYEKVIDKKDNRIGIGQNMPSITDIVIKMLNKEQDYRFLSAMVHAHHWALQHFGFLKTHDDQMIFENVKGSYFEKHLSADSIFFLCTTSITSLCQALLMNFSLFGYDTKPLAIVIDNAIKKIQPPNESVSH
ncbi:MAG: hypothetical protein Q7T89_12225 [Anaerolineales bacterium]|nr:hypothetical protein [Anaerolineales bacterium]